MEVVAAAAKQHNKAWGSPAFSVEHMRKLHDMGARFLAHGGDFMAFRDMLEKSSGRYDDMLRGKP
jgi:4-hydroxy-2-oxoheptanedioate aldolase